MLAAYEKINSEINNSFYVNNLLINHFQSPFHFHNEIEIMYVIEGTGTRLVGDSVQSFGPGDLVFVGSELPHAWFNNKEYYNVDSSLHTHAIYIQFKPDLFDENFLSLSEMKPIRELLNKSKQGMKFSFYESENIISLIEDICSQTSFKRLTTLLDILYSMSKVNFFEFLNLPDSTFNSNNFDMKRVNKVYEYVMCHFHEKISLNDVADIASLTPQSFCRYFKQRTNKNFSHFLNEVRIGNACKLLIDKNMSVNDICYESGFNNFSAFNKQFKNIMKMTALQYQKRFKFR